MPSAFERAAAMRERGLLPETSNALTDAGCGGRDHFGHREIEYGAVVGGRVVPEWEAAAMGAYPTDDVRRELYGEGWRQALHGFREPAYYGRHKASAVERVRVEGWDAYRASRGITEKEGAE